MGWWTGAKQAIKDCKLAEKRQQELYNETVKHLERYKEMVRPLTRDERIRCVMEDHKNSVHPFERTEGYASAYVNGQISIEERIKSKMTREEAERKIYGTQWGTEKRKEFLDGLEALGLIKFDDPPKDMDMYTAIRAARLETYFIVDKLEEQQQFINSLYHRGYKIVKA